MKKRRSIWRLIPKIIFWGVEILAAFVSYMLIRESIETASNGFFYLCFFSIFIMYTFSFPTVLICWIFNFASKFDDYDSFGEGFKALLLAPITLVKHLFTHAFLIIKYLFECIFGYKETIYSYETPYQQKQSTSDVDNFSPNTTKSREKDPNFFIDIMTSELKKIALYYNPPVPASHFYSDWAERLSCYVNKTLRTVIYSGKVRLKSEFSINKNDIYLIKYSINDFQKSLHSDADSKIAEIQSKYVGFDGQWKVRVNITYEIDSPLQ